VANSVKTNPSIPVKSLIVEIQNRYGYSVSYKKAWKAKQKALEMQFGDWEESYNHLPRWLQALQESLPRTIVQCIGHPIVVDGVKDPSTNILDRVFWAFKPCIDGFNYCKPIVQVDGTSLTGKYHDTLLTVISQDGNRNIFPLAFAIVEVETKEAMIWFFQLLREYVTPKPNICLITDRGKAILSALQSPNIAWEEDGLSSVFCIRHIASNFNKKFKNAELKRQLINIGIFSFFIFNFKFSPLPYLFFHIVTTYEMKQSTVMTKLSAMRSEFPQAVSWIDQIPLEKWAQAFDGGKRFGHMTTNAQTPF